MTNTEGPDLPSGRISGRMLIAIGLVFNCALLGFAYYALIGWPAPEQQAPAAIGGAFAMTDQNGHPVSNATLKGKPYAIFFGFTRCPDVCPTTLNRLVQLRKKLGPDAERINILFVSVDPEQDRPADIGRYLALFDSPIVGLSGNAAQLAQIVRAFHVYYRKVPLEGGDYTVDHTATVFLMDADGQFVTTIDHAESQEMALAKFKRVIG
jgi:protein SCO1/2